MQTDLTTRLLLVGILACLIVLIVQGLRSEVSLRGGPLEEGSVGRYRVMSTRAGSPILIRTDTASGRVWRLELRGGRDRWIELIEPDAKPSEPAPDAAGETETAPPAAPPSEAAPDSGAAADPAASRGHDLDTWLEAARKTDLPPDIRIWAITQLGRSDDPLATEALVGALGDADTRVVSAAVAAAASRRTDPSVAGALEKLRANPDPAVQAALAALEGGDT